MAHRSRSIVVAAAIAAAVAGARPVGATVVAAVGFEAQSRTADRIFVGEVLGVEGRPKPDAPRYFETLVTFRVDEAIAGALPPTLVLRFSGGRVGAYRQSIDGMPEFTVGERYVVLLEPDGGRPLVSPIVGFNQGLYRVVVDEAGGGTRSVVRDRLGRPLPAPLPGAGEALRLGAADPTLDEFRAAIRAARR